MWIAFIFLMMGFWMGYVTGFGNGINWAVGVGLNLVDIDVDEEMLRAGIFNYKNQIGDCFNNGQTKSKLGEMVQSYAVESVF